MIAVRSPWTTLARSRNAVGDSATGTNGEEVVVLAIGERR